MRAEEIVTIQNLNQLENSLINRINDLEKKLIQIPNQHQKRYLRTSGVKKLLQVSDNKLKTMRENGEIPFSFIGATYYYPESEILEILKQNTIKK
jgi:ribosomal protein L28|tara:strand:- start:3125 stop:3409 length:285 start_codon:yes stop_codon:yes gene_type:complete